MRFIKTLGKKIVCSILERQVVKLRKKYQFIVIAVVGSIGKTSTKAAIATVLSTAKKVLYQQGNYNDRATVPLVFFEESLPPLWNAFAWIGVFMRNNRKLRRSFAYDVVVLELGTDDIGQIKEFAYLQPDITVVTAITPEHMSQFKTLDAVAAEELAIASFSRELLVNSDDTPAKYTQNLPHLTYGLTKADYYVTARQEDHLSGQTLSCQLKDMTLSARTTLLGEQGAKIALAAAAVGQLMSLSAEQIMQGLTQIKHFPGRMQILSGISNASLIDDTYNASPAAVTAALEVMYETDASSRIAILGSMNQLGDTSEEAHQIVGNYCDPTKLAEVVTIGKDAKQWLAPAAAQKGCKVSSFDSPYAAGLYVKDHLQSGAVVLAKGSQDGVYAEEALKPLLANPSDASKLVRQSAYWLNVKRKQFKDAPVSVPEQS